MYSNYRVGVDGTGQQPELHWIIEPRLLAGIKRALGSELYRYDEVFEDQKDGELSMTNPLKVRKKLGKQVCPDCGESYYFHYWSNVPSGPKSWKERVQSAYKKHKKRCKN